MNYTVKGSLPTLNDYTNANRRNRFLGAKIKRESTEMVAAQLRGKKKVTSPCIVTFHWYTSCKADYDNIRFAAKFILDGMVEASILKDDNPKFVLGFGGDYFIRVSKGNDKVIIEVEEYEE